MRTLLHLVLINKEIIQSPQNSTFALYGVDIVLDDQDNFWFIESNAGPSIKTDKKGKYDLQFNMFDQMVKIQFILLAEQRIDNFLKQSNWKILYDETKQGTERYANLLKPECFI